MILNIDNLGTVKSARIDSFLWKKQHRKDVCVIRSPRLPD